MLYCYITDSDRDDKRMKRLLRIITAVRIYLTCAISFHILVVNNQPREGVKTCF